MFFYINLFDVCTSTPNKHILTILIHNSQVPRITDNSLYAPALLYLLSKCISLALSQPWLQFSASPAKAPLSSSTSTIPRTAQARPARSMYGIIPAPTGWEAFNHTSQWSMAAVSRRSTFSSLAVAETSSTLVGASGQMEVIAVSKSDIVVPPALAGFTMQLPPIGVLKLRKALGKFPSSWLNALFND